MELTLSTHLLVYQALDDEALAALSASGCSGLEIWLAEPHVPWRSASALAAFAQRLRDGGLQPASVHLPFYPSVPELLQQNQRWSVIDPQRHARHEALQGAAQGLHAAATLGAHCAVLHLGWQRDDWNDHSHGWAREAVSELLPVAHACGVELLLENIISTGTRCAALCQLLDEVDPEQQAGICLDLGHAHVDGGAVAELHAALPRLRHLHVHDNDGSKDQHLAPGCGTLPWTEVLDALQRAAFQGQGALELRDASRGRTPPQEVVLQQHQACATFRARHAALRPASTTPSLPS